MSLGNQLNRYNDQDLAEFKALLERKLGKAIRESELTMAQIEDSNESKSRSSDWMDDTSKGSDYEFLQTLALRQRKHIRDLEYALLRIQHKSYGICVVTGEKIDKRRLLAVPTTTKSLEVKNIAFASRLVKPITKASEGKRKIITKISRKTGLTPESVESSDFDHFSDTSDLDTMFDLDEFSEMD
jgi:RNA polymerase-binding protein DksA